MIQIDKTMPDGCDVCPLMYDYIQCNALPEGCKDDDAFNEEEFDWTKRPEWCPLKEQEAVEPIPYHRSDGTIFKYECRKCRTKIFKMDLFCRRCGRPVKWNE